MIKVIQTVDHRHQTLDLGEGKELGYLDTNEYEELGTKGQESLRILHNKRSAISRQLSGKTRAQGLGVKDKEEPRGEGRETNSSDSRLLTADC